MVGHPAVQRQRGRAAERDQHGRGQRHAEDDPLRPVGLLDVPAADARHRHDEPDRAEPPGTDAGVPELAGGVAEGVREPAAGRQVVPQPALRLDPAVGQPVADHPVGHPVELAHHDRGAGRRGGERPAVAAGHRGRDQDQHVDTEQDRAAHVDDVGVPDDGTRADRGEGTRPPRAGGQPGVQQQQPAQPDRREQHVGEGELAVVHDRGQGGRDERERERQPPPLHPEHAPAEQVRQRERQGVDHGAERLRRVVDRERVAGELVDRRQQQRVAHPPERGGVVAVAAGAAGEHAGGDQVPVLVAVRDRGGRRLRQPHPPGDLHQVPDDDRRDQPPAPGPALFRLGPRRCGGFRWYRVRGGQLRCGRPTVR